MSIDFSADNVLSIAQQIERNGAQFYRVAADYSCAVDVRRMLLDLASMEDDHEKTFTKLRGKLTADEKQPTVFDPDSQEAAYLRTMADSNVFNPRVDPAERLTGDESLDEILRTAIGLEKDSVVFYQGLKMVVPKRLGGKKLDNIIEEEMRHIALLSDKLASL
jgi:rubrerythrin